MRVFDDKLADWPGSARHDLTGLVVQEDTNLRIALGLDRIFDLGVRPGDIRGERDIANVGVGRRIELDWTLDARIVEEVEVRRIGYHVTLAWNLFFSVRPTGSVV